jgi:OAR motif
MDGLSSSGGVVHKVSLKFVSFEFGFELTIVDFRNNSIACLRAKAQEHQARLLEGGQL